jgi:hypothetical protein
VSFGSFLGRLPNCAARTQAFADLVHVGRVRAALAYASFQSPLECTACTSGPIHIGLDAPPGINACCRNPPISEPCPVRLAPEGIRTYWCAILAARRSQTLGRAILKAAARLATERVDERRANGSTGN